MESNWTCDESLNQWHTGLGYYIIMPRAPGDWRTPWKQIPLLSKFQLPCPESLDMYMYIMQGLDWSPPLACSLRASEAPVFRILSEAPSYLVHHVLSPNYDAFPSEQHTLM